MKKLVSALLALVLVLSLSAALASEGMMTGGWEIVSAEGAVLPDEAVAALEKALEKMDGASYVPVTLMATQIVPLRKYHSRSLLVSIRRSLTSASKLLPIPSGLRA